MMKTAKLAVVPFAFGIGLQFTEHPALAQPANVVVQWNEIAQAQFGTAPSSSQRSLAMLHIAVFDAINAIEEAYTPYHVQVRASRGASPVAAAAKAARDVLTALYPAQQSTFDSALASQLADIPPGLARQGSDVGAAAARAVLTWRQNDGWPATFPPDPTYVLPPFPGLWQPTPPANSLATFTFYGKVVPFAMVSSTQLLPPAPPTLTSARYAADFNEVKLLGSVISAARTPEQTLMAQVFGGVNVTIGFVHVWNIVAGSAAQSEGLSLVDTARLFALLNVALHDGLQTSFTSKFVYGLWRPVTAVRRADEDLNPATEADPTWLPLLNTPPYPAYAGNAACLSAAAARALQIAVGRDDVPFTITWTRTMGLPPVTRSCPGFWQLADDQARSRIHGGIHYQFDSDASQAACVKVPEFTAAHYMLPR